jgi:hypothetical protein
MPPTNAAPAVPPAATSTISVPAIIGASAGIGAMFAGLTYSLAMLWRTRSRKAATPSLRNSHSIVDSLTDDSSEFGDEELGIANFHKKTRRGDRAPSIGGDSSFSLTGLWEYLDGEGTEIRMTPSKGVTFSPHPPEIQLIETKEERSVLENGSSSTSSSGSIDASACDNIRDNLKDAILNLSGEDNSASTSTEEELGSQQGSM